MRGTEEIMGGEGGIPEPGQFETVGDWFKYVRSEGFNVPVQVPHAISRVMDTFDVDHQDAFTWLVERRLLTVVKRVVIVDLRATHIDLKKTV